MISAGRDGGIVMLTIDRPEALNAFDVDTLTALRDALLEVAEDPEDNRRVRVAPFSGRRS